MNLAFRLTLLFSPLIAFGYWQPDLPQLPRDDEGLVVLSQAFESTVLLADSLDQATPEQWVSSSEDRTRRWTQVFDETAYEGRGFMSLPPSQEPCELAYLGSPVISVPSCARAVAVVYWRKFVAGEIGSNIVYLGSIEGVREPLGEHILQKREDGWEQVAALFVGPQEGDLRLWLQSPTSCSGLSIDNIKLVLLGEMSTRITSHPPGLVHEAVGHTATFEAESMEEATDFYWQLNRKDVDHEAVKFEGEKFPVTFEEPGRYEVLVFAKGQCGLDPRPDIREIIVTEAVAVITNPPHEEEETILEEEGQKKNFEAFVIDPQNKIKQIVFMRGDTPQCTVEDPEGVSSCEIAFDQKGKTVVALVAIGQDDQVLFKDRRVIDVAPPLRARIISPSKNEQRELEAYVRFEGEALGEFADDENTTAQWIINGKRYAGKVVEVPMEFLRHGHLRASFQVKNTVHSVFDEALVRFFAEDPDRNERPRIVKPHTDWQGPPGMTLFFDATAGLMPPDDLAVKWEIVDQATGTVVKTGESFTLGNVTFDEIGTYVATLYYMGGDQSEAVEQREIIVTETDIQDNDKPENAPSILNGRYTNIPLDRNHYYKATVPAEGHNIRVTFTLEAASTIVFYPGDGEVRVPYDAGTHTLQLRGLDPGTYTWGVEPIEEATKRALNFSFSISVQNPTLFFTDIAVDDHYETELGIVNPTNETADVELVGYDDQGNILCKVAQQISARGSYRDTATNIFGEHAQNVSWVRVDSTHDMVGFSNTKSFDALESYATSAAKYLARELYVPHIAENTETWYTRASVVNGQDKSIAPIMVTLGGEATLSNSKSYTQDSFDLVSKLGGSVDTTNNWATFRDSDSGATLAGNEIFGTKDGTSQVVGLGLTGSPSDNPNFTTGASSLYFTHITNSADFWTGLALVNRGEVQQGVVISAVDTNGVATTGTLLLEPGQKLVKEARALLAEANIQSDDVQWLEVQADVEVTGYELFGTLTGGKRLAGIEAINEIKTSICMPYVDTTGASWHGVAVVNVDALPATVNFVLYNESGTEVGRLDGQSLGARQKKIFTLSELFGELDPTASWLEVEATCNLVGFELFGGQSNEYMSGVMAQ